MKLRPCRHNVGCLLVLLLLVACNRGEGHWEAPKSGRYDVVLLEAGSKKIGVIKAVRNTARVGLKDAKEMVDAAPTIVVQNVSEVDAIAIKERIEAAGARVEIRSKSVQIESESN